MYSGRKKVNVNAAKAIRAVVMLPGRRRGVHDGFHAGPNTSQGTCLLLSKMYDNTTN